MAEPAFKLCAPFVAALQEDREALNTRFALRLRGGAKIDGGALLEHLARAVSPLVEQVHSSLPERTRSVVTALYDVSLDLFTASLLGPEAKMSWVQRVWLELLPATTKLLAREPHQVAGSLCNAAYQIASQPGARPQPWIEHMQRIAAHCESASELLEAGKIAAWQAGMVQFRAAALSAAEQLRTPLASVALGIDESMSAGDLAKRINQLKTDVWLRADHVENNSTTAAIESVASVGAFIGFGGLFLRPPTVESVDNRLFVSDGRWQWELLADAYGAWFRKQGAAANTKTKPTTKNNIAIDRQGTIRWDKHTLKVPHLAHASSFAAGDQTLAVTIPTSHHVFLFSHASGRV